VERVTVTGAAAADRLPATGESGGQRRLILAFGLVAALPVIVAAGHAIAVRWVPLSDLAYTAVKSFDVFTSRSPLVGQWSSGATAAVDEVTYSPGPLLFWLLAVPTRWLGPSAPAVTAGLVNVASVIGLVGLAQRRGGRPLMLATAIAIPVMLVSLPAETYSDPWNSSAALLPLALLVFLAWSLACGEYRLLPLAVLVASFAAQCHLTFAVPAVAVLAVGVAGLAVTRRVEGRAAAAGAEDGRTGGERASLRRWAAAAVVVGVVCWSAPLIDQATNDPGNLSLLAQAATTGKPTLGFDAGWHATVHALGVVPWWLQQPRSVLARISDLAEAPGAISIASAVLVLAALVAVMVVGWRRRRPDVWAAGALGLALAAAVAVDAASTPKEALPTVVYTLRWVSPAGMCVWLMLGLAVAVLVWPPSWTVPVPARIPAALVGLAVATALAVVVAVTEDPVRQPYRQMRTLDHRVAAALPPDRATRVEAADLYASAFQAGLVFWLRHEGRDVVAPDMRKPLGRDYAEGSYDRVVLVGVQDPKTAAQHRPPGRIIARLRYDQPFTAKPAHMVVVTLRPAAAVP
jgi:hypothetical protein